MKKKNQKDEQKKQKVTQSKNKNKSEVTKIEELAYHPQKKEHQQEPGQEILRR